MSRHKVWVEISKENLTHNISTFKKLVGDQVKIMSVVKSNAYGHGLVDVAKITLKAGADWLAVDSIDEAVTLRKVGISAPILVLGYTLLERLDDAVNYDIELVVYNSETIKALWVLTSKEKPVKVHIKVETGTNRQGLLRDQVIKLAKLIKEDDGLILNGLSTHFANIEDTTDSSYAKKQLAKFNEVVDELSKQGIEAPYKHAASSAATILFPETHFNIVRVGLSQYGLWPSKETIVSSRKQESGVILKPALSWKAVVAQIKQVEKGESISYGCTEKLNKDSVVAVLPIGYWDGFDRKLSSIGNVLIKGQRAKVLGRVCMNIIIVDITEIKDVKLGEEVVLLGKQGSEEISAEEMANKVGTINYEVVTRINPLIPRIMV